MGARVYNVVITGLGLVAGLSLYLGVAALGRQAAANRRLILLEHPSPAVVRRQITAAIGDLTPAQSRALLERLLEGLPSRTRHRLERSLRHARRPRTSSGSSGSSSPAPRRVTGSPGGGGAPRGGRRHGSSTASASPTSPSSSSPSPSSPTSPAPVNVTAPAPLALCVRGLVGLNCP